MSRPTKLLAAFAAVLSCLAINVSAQTFRSVPSGYATIQAAIDDCVNGDTVNISPGTYIENINFNGKAITVRGAWGANLTTIDGGDNGPVVTFESGETSSSVLADLTITHGRGMDSSSLDPQAVLDFVASAGGIWIRSSFPTIRGCVITNNVGGNADGRFTFAGGGGIGIHHDPDLQVVGVDGLNPQIESVKIEKCKIKANFGGIQLSTDLGNQLPLVGVDGFGPLRGHGGAGGVHVVGSGLSMTGCVVEDNHGGSSLHFNTLAGSGGLEMSLQDGPCILDDCSVIDNIGGDGNLSSIGAGAGGARTDNNMSMRGVLVQGNRGGNLTDNFSQFPVPEGLGTDGGELSRAGTGGLESEFLGLLSCQVKNNIGGDLLLDFFLINSTTDGSDLLIAGTGGIDCQEDSFVLGTLIVGNKGGDVFGEEPGTLVDGEAPRSGTGGISFSKDLDLVLCTVADNKGGIGSSGFSEGGLHSGVEGGGEGDSEATISSSILWGNRGFQRADPFLQSGDGSGPPLILISDSQFGAGDYFIDYSDIEGGDFGDGASSSNTNIDVDPQFVDPANCDYHLLVTSPCVNTGDPNTFLPGDVEDIDGDPRLMENLCDMGADETNERHYPGANSDLVLETRVNYWGATDSSVRFVTSGDFVSMGLRSPLGTYLSSTFMIFGQAFLTGNPPSEPGTPELHLDLLSVATPAPLILIAPGGFEMSESFVPNGRFWGFNVPNTYPGFSLMVQGVALDPLMIPTVTDAHELRFR